MREFCELDSVVRQEAEPASIGAMVSTEELEPSFSEAVLPTETAAASRRRRLSSRWILLSRPDGWAAYSPDGHYKMAGHIDGAFWHLIGLHRFEPGELDPYLAESLEIAADAPLPALAEHFASR